jgi:DNA-directed RNA polymerase specialized sigma24 family protein
MWNALKTFDPMKGTLDYWLKFKARHAMNSYMTKRKAERGFEEEAVTFESEESQVVHEPDMSGIELAYHYGEIGDAIDRLTPQQKKYVQLRFWDGYKGQELKEAFGYDPQALWSSSKNGAKKKLRGDLAHLAEVA